MKPAVDRPKGIRSETAAVDPIQEAVLETAAEQAPSFDAKGYFESIFSGESRPAMMSPGVRWGRGYDAADPESDPDRFVESLIDFVAEKSAEGGPGFGEEEDLAKFMDTIYELNFSFSPNVINRCSLDGLLALGAAIRRVPAIRTWLGQAVVGETVYMLSFVDDEALAKIESGLEDVPLAEKIDIVNYLQEVARNAEGNGSWSRDGLKRVESFVRRVREESDVPFLRYALDDSISAMERSGQENEALARLEEGRLEESGQLARSIRSALFLTPGEQRYERVSEDAVAIVDRSETPRYYGRIAQADLAGEAAVDFRLFDQLRASITDTGNFSRLNMPKVFDYVNAAIINPALGIKPANSEEVGQVWDRHIGGLPEGQWARFFAAKQRAENLRDEVARQEAQSYEEAARKNEAASVALMREAYEALAAFDFSRSSLANEWAGLSGLVEGGDFGDEAYDLTAVLLAAVSRNQENPDLNGLVEKWMELQTLHIANFQEASRQTDELSSRLEDERVETAREYGDLLREIAGDVPRLQGALQGFLSRIGDELLQRVPTVDFQPYENLSADRRINPFPGDTPDDLAFLVQQLHRPAIRDRMELDLGISLSDFNLNSQVHLLQFLAGKNGEEFGAIREVLRQDVPYKKEFLTSFLSCAGDYSFGDSLVGLAKGLPPEAAEAVFGKYAELVGAAEGVKEYLRGNFGEELEQDEGLESAIVQNVLRSGQDILRKAAATAENRPVEDLLADLENARSGAALFKAALHALRATGESVRSVDFRSVRFQETAGLALDEETKRQMLLVSDDNWLGTDEKGRGIAERFRALLGNQEELAKCTFYLTAHEDDILGFFMLKKDDGADRYFLGSINARRDMAGTDVGLTMLDTVIAGATAGKNVWGKFSPKTRVASTYINEMAFAGVGFIHDQEPYDTLEVERDRRPNAPVFESAFKGLSYGELKEMAESGEKSADRQVACYVFPDQYDQFAAEAAARMENGLVLSALVPERYRKAGPYNVAVGFERRPNSSLQE